MVVAHRVERVRKELARGTERAHEPLCGCMRERWPSVLVNSDEVDHCCVQRLRAITLEARPACTFARKVHPFEQEIASEGDFAHVAAYVVRAGYASVDVEDHMLGMGSGDADGLFFTPPPVNDVERVELAVEIGEGVAHLALGVRPRRGWDVLHTLLQGRQVLWESGGADAAVPLVWGWDCHVRPCAPCYVQDLRARALWRGNGKRFA